MTNVSATCLCLTHCGNFVVIGYSTGHVDRFNIQSGIHRHVYGSDTAHNCPVRGVTTDSINQVVVTAGSNGEIKFWSFKEKTNTPISNLVLSENISFIRSHRESSMVCVAMEDFSICVIDVDTRSLVRKFIGHTGQVTDATFSPDSRWIMTASMDCTIKTWDVPSAQLIDQFKVEVPCISLTMSPVGDFLATTHVDYLGIFLWANRTLYSHVSLRALKEINPILTITDLPNSINDKSGNVEDLDLEEDELEFKSPAQISEELITLSTLSTSRWQNLLNIDIVKKRNKPKAPPKTPKAAPFFLPTIPSLQMQFDLGNNSNPSQMNNLLMPESLQNLSVFGVMLKDSDVSDHFEEALEKIKTFGPSTIDLEITTLAPEGGGSFVVMLQFLKMINYMFQSNKDFELAQAYLGLFLKKHGNIIAQNKKLLKYLDIIEISQRKGWVTLENQLFYALSVVQALKNI